MQMLSFTAVSQHRTVSRKRDGTEISIQTVYLSDMAEHMLTIELWGRDEVTAECKVGSIVAIQNLTFRRVTESSQVICNANEYTIFQSNPRAAHLRSAMDAFLTLVPTPEARQQMIDVVLYSANLRM